VVKSDGQGMYEFKAVPLGKYTLTVTIAHDSATPNLVVTPTATVSDPSVVGTGNDFSAIPGVAFTAQTVATFTDPAGAEPLARYVGTAAAGVHPDYMGIGPVPAMTKVLARNGWAIDDLDLAEVNEAFAAQAVAVLDELKLDPARVNVNGGAIAIGHPLGCSGARITTTLLHERQRRGAARAAASMCIGVGQGIATLWEAP